MKNITHNINAIFLIFSLFFAHTISSHNDISTDIQPGIIILLNGTSSAGKTTIARALHTMYDTFKVASIDTYTRGHQCGSWKTKCNGFYKEVKEKALSGHNVIVDTVLYHNNYEAYDALLKNDAGHHADDKQTQPIQLIKILVYCPLEALFTHVQQRNNSGNSLEKRTMHKACIAFLTLYTIKNSTHNNIIDTIDSAATQTALQSTLKTIHRASHKHLKRQHRMNRKIIRRFHLEASDKIALAPKHPWDLIVNSATNTPEEIAQQIANFIESRIK